jgi:antagonist of KipI
MDRFAHRAANLLVGNAASDATLECTIKGPQLVAESDCVVAITGADLGANVPGWTSVSLRAGDHVSFAGRRAGGRAYVAVAGGFDGDRWLGSRSTYLLARRGGMHGRALAAGDVLDAVVERDAVEGRTLLPAVRPDYESRTLHAIAGPHLTRIGADGRRALLSATYTVTPESDRMGVRLAGPPLPDSGDDVLSFGLVAGALQLPGSGRPILLLADHQTAGGYPVVAVVISASMPVAGQLVPGDEVRFELVTAAQARTRRLQQAAALATLT